jgi:hypothetical protein
LNLLERLKRLIWHRLVWRQGKAVGINPPPARIAPRPRRHRVRHAGTRMQDATVRQLQQARAVSTLSCEMPQETRSHSGGVGNQLVQEEFQHHSAGSIGHLTKTALCDGAESLHFEQDGNQGLAEFETPPFDASAASHQVSAAARALASLPRRPRRHWSGWLDPKNPDSRIWRGRRIVLPNFEVCYAYGCTRNKVVWSRHDQGLQGGFCGEPFEWGVLPASAVRPWKNPHAVALGRQKRGIHEKPSLAKQNAARANGRRPTRPGRRRGRRPARSDEAAEMPLVT